MFEIRRFAKNGSVTLVLLDRNQQLSVERPLPGLYAKKTAATVGKGLLVKEGKEPDNDEK